jgi:hypothetical protein
VSATSRNVVIVLVLAAALAFVPGGGQTAEFIGALFGFAFLGGLVFFAGRLYMEHRVAIFSLGERRRVIAYSAIGIALLALTASSRLFETGAGTVAWFVMVGGASYALFWVWQSTREY